MTHFRFLGPTFRDSDSVLWEGLPSKQATHQFGFMCSHTLRNTGQKIQEAMVCDNGGNNELYPGSHCFLQFNRKP